MKRFSVYVVEKGVPGVEFETDFEEVARFALSKYQTQGKRSWVYDREVGDCLRKKAMRRSGEFSLGDLNSELKSWREGING